MPQRSLPAPPDADGDAPPAPVGRPAVPGTAARSSSAAPGGATAPPAASSGVAGTVGAPTWPGRPLQPRRPHAAIRAAVHDVRDAGMATAEYAIVTLAAVGFAGLLLVILRSGEVRGLLLGIVRTALGAP